MKSFFGLKACLTSDHQTFVRSIQGCHRCINHDIIVGLCSEVIMRLSYYIFPSRIWQKACLNACLMSDRQTFVRSIQGRTCHGCISHYIVVGLCSEVLMILFYYIHLGFGKKFVSSHGDRTTVLPIVSRLLYPYTRALTYIDY